jgi:hypothetical protein
MTRCGTKAVFRVTGFSFRAFVGSATLSSPFTINLFLSATLLPAMTGTGHSFLVQINCLVFVTPRKCNDFRNMYAKYLGKRRFFAEYSYHERWPQGSITIYDKHFAILGETIAVLH